MAGGTELPELMSPPSTGEGCLHGCVRGTFSRMTLSWDTSELFQTMFLGCARITDGIREKHTITAAATAAATTIGSRSNCGSCLLRTMDCCCDRGWSTESERNSSTTAAALTVQG